MVRNRTVSLEVEIQESTKVSRNQYATREDGLAGDVRAGWRYVRYSGTEFKNHLEL